jgi:hypothetical protein
MRGRQTHTGFWWESLKKRDPLGKPKHRWEDNLQWKEGKQDRRIWPEYIWRGGGPITWTCEESNELRASKTAGSGFTIRISRTTVALEFTHFIRICNPKT